MKAFFLIPFGVIVTSYLIGSFPTAYVIGRVVAHIDIRKRGSGNVGATNVFRISGIFPGLITLIVDAGKGFAVIFAFSHLEKINSFFLLLSGLAAVIGHNWPVFLKFKGGKGVATTLGICLALFPQATLSVLLIWLLVAVLSRYVSLSSIIAAFTIPLFIWIYLAPLNSKHLMGPNGTSLALSVAFGLVLALLILWRHQGNVKRLICRQERKINFSKNGQK